MYIAVSCVVSEIIECKVSSWQRWL